MSDEQQQEQPVAIGISDSAAGTTAGEQPAGMAAQAAAAEAAATAKAPKAKAAPAQAEPAPEQAAPAAAPNLDEVYAGFLTTVQAILLRHGFGADIEPHVLRTDDEGGILAFIAKGDRGLARSAATAVLNGGDGREYRWCGDGPGPQGDLQAAYLHVSPLS